MNIPQSMNTIKTLLVGWYESSHFIKLVDCASVIHNHRKYKCNHILIYLKSGGKTYSEIHYKF